MANYNYRCRPGYGSEELLIEFTSEVENPNFLTDLFDAIKEINPVLSDKERINEEINYTINTDSGQFSLAIDIWSLAFLMSDNQECIFKINRLLIEDERFEKIEVNFDDYKTPD